MSGDRQRVMPASQLDQQAGVLDQQSKRCRRDRRCPRDPFACSVRVAVCQVGFAGQFQQMRLVRILQTGAFCQMDRLAVTALAQPLVPFPQDAAQL